MNITIQVSTNLKQIFNASGTDRNVIIYMPTGEPHKHRLALATFPWAQERQQKMDKLTIFNIDNGKISENSNFTMPYNIHQGIWYNSQWILFIDSISNQFSLLNVGNKPGKTIRCRIPVHFEKHSVYPPFLHPFKRHTVVIPQWIDYPKHYRGLELNIVSKKYKFTEIYTHQKWNTSLELPFFDEQELALAVVKQVRDEEYTHYSYSSFINLYYQKIMELLKEIKEITDKNERELREKSAFMSYIKLITPHWEKIKIVS